jgi:hypothetical protein
MLNEARGRQCQADAKGRRRRQCPALARSLDGVDAARPIRAVEPRFDGCRQTDRGARSVAQRQRRARPLPVLGRRGSLQGARLREIDDQHHEHGELSRTRRSERRPHRSAAASGDAALHQGARGSGPLTARSRQLSGRFHLRKSGRAQEALRYYDEALQYGRYAAGRAGAAACRQEANYRSPRIEPSSAIAIRAA